MIRQQLPAVFWGLDSVFWTNARLFVSDIHGLKDYDCLPGNSYCLNGLHPIHRVCVIGVAVEVKVHATNTNIFIDDGTGIILATSWHNGDQPVHQHCLGRILKVTGKLSTFRGEHQINISSINEIHDPNIEVLHWAQVIQLQASVYQQEDAIVKDALGLFPTHEGSAADSSDPTQYCIDLELLEGESQRNNLDRNPWDEAVQACMDLVPSGREVLFSEMCSNVGLSSLVVTRHPAIGTSAHDIALAISKVVNRCVAQGTLVQWSPDRDSYMRLDTALVCKLITSEFQLCSNEPMSLARILAAIRQKVQFAGVQLHMVNEAIRDLENSHVIRRQSINTFMLA